MDAPRADEDGVGAADGFLAQVALDRVLPRERPEGGEVERRRAHRLWPEQQLRRRTQRVLDIAQFGPETILCGATAQQELRQRRQFAFDVPPCRRLQAVASGRHGPRGGSYGPPP